ncbi:MAG: hypothetical protein EOM12_12935 [Verrucomicrobiae bacterium]|nr:hypothetical protein [Verrucomicrobiae bacterium]
MFDEYAITPDVFDEGIYAHPEVHKQVMNRLYEELVKNGFVRDLQNGYWGLHISESLPKLSTLTQKLLLQLFKTKRIIIDNYSLPSEPSTTEEWTNTALGSHNQSKLTGIITGTLKCTNNPLIAQSNNLDDAAWWSNRTHKITVPRKAQALANAYKTLLRQSTSLLLIDPFIDPSIDRYFNSLKVLLNETWHNEKLSLIELHRVSITKFDDKLGRKVDRKLPAAEWEHKFQRLSQFLTNNNQSATVYIWEKSRKDHDRYLISDLAATSLTNGFDYGESDVTITTIGREERNKVERRYHPNFRPPQYTFRIGKC